MYWTKRSTPATLIQEMPFLFRRRSLTTDPNVSHRSLMNRLRSQMVTVFPEDAAIRLLSGPNAKCFTLPRFRSDGNRSVTTYRPSEARQMCNAVRYLCAQAIHRPSEL